MNCKEPLKIAWKITQYHIAGIQILVRQSTIIKLSFKFIYSNNNVFFHILEYGYLIIIYVNKDQ